jgi:hypothetical protein
VALRPFLRHPEPGWSVPRPGGAESTGAPRCQVAGSAHNNFWRCRDRWGSPRVASPPEVLARPKGCPLRNLTLARLPVGGAGIERRMGAVRTDRRQQQFSGRVIKWTRPTSTPDSRASTNSATSPSTSPHRPNSTNPFTAIQPSDCSTRVALEEILASPMETTVVSTAVGAGSPESTAKRQRGSAAAVADGAIGTW